MEGFFCAAALVTVLKLSKVMSPNSVRRLSPVGEGRMRNILHFSSCCFTEINLQFVPLRHLVELCKAVSTCKLEADGREALPATMMLGLDPARTATKTEHGGSRYGWYSSHGWHGAYST